jgi:hypothetical protein
MPSNPRSLSAAVALPFLAVLAIAGCAPTAGTAPPEARPAPARSTVAPGMNASGEVVDSSKVGAGSGQKVKGIGNWEGEITGKARAGAPFTKLQIGMSMGQVIDLIGKPTDQGAYMTGKAWIPFYYGSDRHRYEFAYKNQGRLVFAGGSLGNYSGGNLIWIIHNATDPGYR